MADLKLARFNLELCNFPRPRVPLLPTRSKLGLVRSDANKFAQKNTFKHFTRGRYALGAAYRLSGVGHDNALLAPAYHCVTMLDPALNLGADILLYPLNADLSPDLGKLNDILIKTRKPVKAMLATHFFGFPQDFCQLKQWCDKHRISLIEDCSHVLCTENFQATGTGIFGRFVAASPYKFFACEDGGLLYSPEENLLDSVRTESAGLMKELRGIKHGIDNYRSSVSMASEIAVLDEQVQALSMTPVVYAKEEITAYSEPSSLFSHTEAKTRALHCSRLIVSISSIDKNITHRRNNYERWIKAVAKLPNCHPQYPELPTHCVPYMFPLHINHPEPHFYWLKHLGVPIWRWDDMAVSNCLVAQDYRLHLLHLPCHQALTEDQMDWMIAALQKTLSQPIQGAL